MEFNRAAASARLARVAEAMGDEARLDDASLAANAIARVRRLTTELRLPPRLRDAGVREDDLPRIARNAFEDASHQANPRPCGEADLLAIARAAY
jgi:alcohol dehydrogenase class IV